MSAATVAPDGGGVLRPGRRPIVAARRAGAALAAVVGPLARIAAGWARPRLAVLSVAGWITLGFTVAMLVAGCILGWAELLVAGATAAIVVVACVPFAFGRPRYHVGVELQPSRVVVGDRALGRMTVTNTRARRSLPSGMELPVGRAVARFAIPGLAAGAEHEELFQVPTSRRAVIVAGPAVSVRGDQLGLIRRTLRWTDPIELFVRPRTVRLAPSAAGLVRDLEGRPTRTITSNDLSFHALRPYAPGDDRRNVHWRSTARTGTLMVRQFEETRRSQFTIVLSESAAHYASEEEFELAVSTVASIGARVLDEDTRVSIVSDVRALRTHGLGALLDDACRFEFGSSRRTELREVAREATRSLPDPSVVVLVGGTGLDAAGVRRAASLFAVDATVFGIRAVEGSSPELRSVGRIPLVSIGALADLPAVITRVGAQ